MSTNAITTGGELVNIDGTGNRVAALIYGPETVVILAGMNKIAANVDEALSRVHNVATAQNCIRLDKKTPCAITGAAQTVFLRTVSVIRLSSPEEVESKDVSKYF